MSRDLTQLDPKLQAVIPKVLAAMEAIGFPMLVTDAKRSTAEQQALYAKGRTAPGPIVTHADGVVNKSNHQYGRAVDCCFLVDGKPSWDARLPWKAYGAIAEALGCRWGGSFQTLHDLPHVELV